MPYTAVLFDLDGTITDSQSGILRCTQYALHACGIKESDSQKLLRFIGPPLSDSFATFYGMKEPMISFAIKKYRERYSTIGWKENRVYNGIPECLQALKLQGCQIAMATSKPKPYAKQILDYFKLTPFFDAIAGSSMEHSNETKSELIQQAMRQLGISETEHVIMVGDRKFDAEGADVCGIAFAGVRYGYAPTGELESYPHVCLADTVSALQHFLTAPQRR